MWLCHCWWLFVLLPPRSPGKGDRSLLKCWAFWASLLYITLCLCQRSLLLCCLTLGVGSLLRFHYLFLDTQAEDMKLLILSLSSAIISWWLEKQNHRHHRYVLIWSWLASDCITSPGNQFDNLSCEAGLDGRVIDVTPVLQVLLWSYGVDEGASQIACRCWSPALLAGKLPWLLLGRCWTYWMARMCDAHLRTVWDLGGGGVRFFCFTNRFLFFSLPFAWYWKCFFYVYIY